MTDEIIVLPGAFGLHLEDVAGQRLWLDPDAIVRGDVPARLSLDARGEEAPDPALDVRVGEPVGFIYDRLLARLEGEGFKVHVFRFDYRKSLLGAARELRAFVAERVAPGTRIWLVAHSIGAILASLYPHYPDLDPNWRDRVAGSIFLGGTIRGTYEPIEAVSGDHWFLEVVGVGDPERIAALRQCLRTWPGLFSMLPDPTIFEDAERFYQASEWPAEIAPRQEHLDEARRIKRLVLESPLVQAPTAQILSTSYHTIRAPAPGPGPIRPGPKVAAGDDTVPLFAASLPGIQLYRAEYPHTFLPADQDVIQAVVDLATTGACKLPVIPEGEISGNLPPFEMPPPLAMFLGMSHSVLRHLVTGTLDLRDIPRLLRRSAP
jgi:hypothetical protein